MDYSDYSESFESCNSKLNNCKIKNNNNNNLCEN